MNSKTPKELRELALLLDGEARGRMRERADVLEWLEQRQAAAQKLDNPMAEATFRMVRQALSDGDHLPAVERKRG